MIYEQKTGDIHLLKFGDNQKKLDSLVRETKSVA